MISLNYDVHSLRQYMFAPHTVQLIRLYLKNDPCEGLFYSTSPYLHLTAFSDLNWVAYPDSRFSTTGYCVFFLLKFGTDIVCFLVIHSSLDFSGNN